MYLDKAAGRPQPDAGDRARESCVRGETGRADRGPAWTGRTNWQDALATYAQASGGTKEDAIKQVQGEAVPAMLAAFEKLQAFFHACEYESALDAEPRRVLPTYLRAIDHVLGKDDGWKRFRQLVKELAEAFALAVPRPETTELAPHLAFFQRVAAMIRKRLTDESGGGRRRRLGAIWTWRFGRLSEVP